MKGRGRNRAETVQIAKAGLVAELRDIPKEASDRLIRQASELLEAEIERERDRCAEVCRQRSDLWRPTTMSQTPGNTARDEARARANGLYIADLLGTGSEPAEGGSTGA